MAEFNNPEGLAISFPAISGAEPCTASNIAYSFPIFALPASPTEPDTSEAMSDIISPYKLRVTITSKFSGLFASFAEAISTNICSAFISGYSGAILRKIS